MPSAIAAATVALHKGLVESADLAGVQKTFGPPDAAEEQEVVAILGISDADEEFAALGAGRMEESWRIDVKVKVYDPTDSSDTGGMAAFLRAEDIRESIRSVVAADRTLADTVRVAQMGAKAYTWANVDGGGRVLFIDCPIQCRARIT